MFVLGVSSVISEENCSRDILRRIIAESQAYLLKTPQNPKVW